MHGSRHQLPPLVRRVARYGTPIAFDAAARHSEHQQLHHEQWCIETAHRHGAAMFVAYSARRLGNLDQHPVVAAPKQFREETCAQ